jgi:hypothetical protein
VINKQKERWERLKESYARKKEAKEAGSKGSGSLFIPSTQALFLNDSAMTSENPPNSL